MKIIDKCCICGKEVSEILNLPFYDLQGSDCREYIQKVGICKNCGFVFTQNPFSEQQLENRYKNESKFEFDNKNYFLDDSDEYKERCNRQKNFITRLTNKFDSILEIGASSGYNLKLYADKDVVGIEPSKINCLLAEQNYGIKMFSGTFDEYYKTNFQKADLIFLSHTLEHIVNPMEFMKKCSNLCNKYIFVEVPCFDYKFMDEPFGMFCEEHVNYFTFESLSNIMNNLGYSIVDADFVFRPYLTLPAGYPAISTLWKKEIEKGVVFKKKIVNNTEQIVKKYIADSNVELERVSKLIDSISDSERLAVWGTGHHASMLAANTSLKQKNIVRVIDSDVRKTKYSFCGVPIASFDKSDIEQNRFDSILIATYTAQKSIYNAVQQYENKLKIYQLY